jgi:hypothetical protein
MPHRTIHHKYFTSINMIGKRAAANALWTLGVLISFFAASGSAKVKRVKAGKIYNTHDAVSIVVNKVG